MSYRDDGEALVARNVALERQVKDLEARPPAAPYRLGWVEPIARGTASIVGVAGGTLAAIEAAGNWASVGHMWMGCAVASRP